MRCAVHSSRSCYFGAKEEMHSHFTASLWDGHQWRYIQTVAQTKQICTTTIYNRSNSIFHVCIKTVCKEQGTQNLPAASWNVPSVTPFSCKTRSPDLPLLAGPQQSIQTVLPQQMLKLGWIVKQNGRIEIYRHVSLCGIWDKQGTVLTARKGYDVFSFVRNFYQLIYCVW